MQEQPREQAQTPMDTARGKTITTLTNRAGKTFTHYGTSGFTVTATRDGDGLDVLMEFDAMSREEATAMMAALLTQLDELHGEGFVTACIAHYAQDTHKEFVKSGDHQLGILRGERRAKRR